MTPSPCLIGRPNALSTKDYPPRWEVRAWDALHQLFHANIRVVHKGDEPIDELNGAMRGNIRRHPNSDS